MGEQDQDGELVQPAGQGQDGAVGAPPTGGGRPVQGAQQEVAGPDDGGADQGVGAALLRVLLDGGQEGEHRPGERARTPAGEPRPRRADAGGGQCRPGHGGQPEGREAAVPEREDGVQEQVVQAVHGVDAAEQFPECAERAVGDLVGDRLVAPHAVPAVEPPQSERRREQGRREDRYEGRATAGRAGGGRGGRLDRRAREEEGTGPREVGVRGDGLLLGCLGAHGRCSGERQVRPAA